MSTTDNLKEAFAGESQANRKYLAFAKKADAEGYPNIARLFRANAEAETLHAHAHLRVLGGVGDTAANLQAGVEGEGFEFQEMYPKFIAEAEAEGNKGAVISFKNASAAEEVHHGHYQKALATLKAGGDIAESNIHLCTICGNTFVGEVPENCPICKAPKAKFSKID